MKKKSLLVINAQRNTKEKSIIVIELNHKGCHYAILSAPYLSSVRNFTMHILVKSRADTKGFWGLGILGLGWEKLVAHMPKIFSLRSATIKEKILFDIFSYIYIYDLNFWGKNKKNI